MKNTVKTLTVLVLVTLLAASCGKSSKDEAAEATANGPAADFIAKHYRLAYILNVPSTEIFGMAVQGATQTAKALGMTVDVFFSDSDNVKFQDYIDTCANQGYQGMFLSHGLQETSFNVVNDLVNKGIKVVIFDTQLVDAAGKPTSIPGVTQMFQDDQKMCDLILDYACTRMFPGKAAAKEPIRVLKLWMGPGWSPFDRRQENYITYEQRNLIKTLEVLGPTDLANVEVSMSQVVAAALPRYPAGSVDLIWSAYDAFARGAYVAMNESNVRIPMVSVDISNQDINYMLDGTKTWQACSAVDFTTVGEQGVRLLAMKLHGDETEAVYDLTPSLVTIDGLNAQSNILNLKDTVEGYGKNDDHIAPWMESYLKK